MKNNIKELYNIQSELNKNLNTFSAERRRELELYRAAEDKANKDLAKHELHNVIDHVIGVLYESQEALTKLYLEETYSVAQDSKDFNVFNPYIEKEVGLLQDKIKAAQDEAEKLNNARKKKFFDKYGNEFYEAKNKNEILKHELDDLRQKQKCLQLEIINNSKIQTILNSMDYEEVFPYVYMKDDEFFIELELSFKLEYVSNINGNTKKEIYSQTKADAIDELEKETDRINRIFPDVEISEIDAWDVEITNGFPDKYDDLYYGKVGTEMYCGITLNFSENFLKNA